MEQNWRYYTLAISLLVLLGCAHAPLTPYETASPQERATWKKVALPFQQGTHFTISQGAFGLRSHHDPGHEYTWDFDVPYGTPVLAVEEGTVLHVWQPKLGGGCDPKYTNAAHNVQIEAADGTVAQYTHIRSMVTVGEKVRRGEQLAVTAMNGFICTPQLDFTIFKDRDHTFLKGHPRDIPLLFEGLPEDGMAHEGYLGMVPFHADPSKVLPWSLALSRHEPAHYPFLVHYQRDNKNLYYVAASHSVSASSPTFHLITSVLDANPIQAMILEGFPHNWGDSPKRMTETVSKEGKNGFFHGEPHFAIQKALKRGIIFTGGEPDDLTLLESVLKDGYSKRDLFFFYFVRQIPQYQREGIFRHESIESAYRELKSVYQKRLHLTASEIPTFNDFRSWYKSKNGAPFPGATMDSENAAPYEHGKLFTQRLSAAVDKARNAYTVSVIADLLNRFDNVLVVYGGSHWSAERPAIEEMLGTPVAITAGETQ